MDLDKLGRRLPIKVRQGRKQLEVDLSQSEYLRTVGIQSVRQIADVDTSIYFPPSGKYRGNGRSRKGMPDTYLPIGSGSYLVHTTRCEERAVSLVFFHDTKVPEVNVHVWGWPKGIADPDWTKSLPGDLHSLRDNEDIEVIIAEGTCIKKQIVLKMPPRSPPAGSQG